MILSCNNISKAYGIDEILNNVSFNVEKHEKVAVVGINGAGKSTLLKIIAGEITPDGGNVFLAKDTSLGYLSQHQDLTSDNSIYDELLSIKKDIIEMEAHLRELEQKMKNAGEAELSRLMDMYSRVNHDFETANGYAYKSELTGVLKGLGFSEDDFSKKVSALSGGQKTRVALGKLLLTKPDLILLDEPTNHLDLKSITWLENYLSNYQGSVIIVSHDRYFLDKIVTKVVGIENSKAQVYSGNYSDFSKKKELVYAAKLKEYYNQQREIKHQEEVITKLKQFNREKSIKRAESREKALERMDIIEKPLEETSNMRLILEPDCISGNDVMSIKDLSKGFDGSLLFDGLNLEIKRGERIALIGDNGTGKSTILKLITGTLLPDGGSIKLGSNVSIGYYDQEHAVLHMDKTIFDEISDAYPDLDNTRIRNVLAAFLFTGDDVFKLIKDTSGGERGRISLAKLMLSNANFLILDEPTNHLDINSKEILEKALNSYTGTVFYVSHDRYFINSTATGIVELSDKVLTKYIGNYDYYIEKKAVSVTDVKSEVSDTKSASREAYKASREEQNRLKRKQNEIAKLEKLIEEAEIRLGEIEELSSKDEIARDISKLMELHKEKESIDEKLIKYYEEWDSLQE